MNNNHSQAIEQLIIKQAEILLEAAASAENPDEIRIMLPIYDAFSELVSQYNELSNRVLDIAFDVSEVADWRKKELEQPSDFNKKQVAENTHIARESIAYQKQVLETGQK
jgi:hypothetical protein